MRTRQRIKAKQLRPTNHPLKFNVRDNRGRGVDVDVQTRVRRALRLIAWFVGVEASSECPCKLVRLHGIVSHVHDTRFVVHTQLFSVWCRIGFKAEFRFIESKAWAIVMKESVVARM